MRNSKIFVAIGSFLIVVSFVVGVMAGKASEASGTVKNSVLDLFVKERVVEVPTDVDMNEFWEVWSLINEKYVTSEMPTNEEKTWGAISGLVGSLEDPYSVFMTPAEAKMFEEDVSGSFDGVGMEIGIRDNILTVVAPLKGTPADVAGLLPGDMIIQIDQETTYDLTLNEAVDKIRGPRGTTVTLMIVREGVDDPIEVKVVRSKIEVPVIDTELREDGVFVISLYSFYETAPQLFEQAISEFKRSGSHTLVLDLRNNPGGFLEAAVDIAGNFLPTGKLVARENYGQGKEETEHRTRGNFTLKDYDYTMIILINQGSASASEILAGALKEHGIATLVGEQSFGKGSVQELIKLENGTSLKLTIARWLTPNGLSISEQGLTPDTEVQLTVEDVEAKKDPQMEKAVEMLLSR